MKDAVKHCKSLYTFGENNGVINREGENKVFQTNEPVTKFINEFITKTAEKNIDSETQNSTRTAQIYFAHKLINVKNYS